MNDEMPPAETSPPQKNRKKSEARQRQKQTKVRWLDEEFNTAAANARAAGLSLGAYIRASTTRDPGERARKAMPLDAGLQRKLIGQLGYYGNNINQTAYELHAFGEKALGQDFDARKREIDEIIDHLLGLIGRPPRPKTA